MIRVAIIGATGYTAYEAIQILLRHPYAEATYLTARGDKCGPVANIFPSLTDRLSLDLEPLDLGRLSERADVAFCCLPHKESMSVVPQLLDAGLKVVDLSADYRLHDVKLYESVYDVPHTDAGNLSNAAFGLPELFRDQIKGASLVANPGCYPTAASLALAPLLKEKLISSNDIVVNAVSGVSGAGRKPKQVFHFPEMNQNYFAYGVGTHRHQPEIEQILSDASGEPVEILFQPHVLNIDRGISESIYAKPTREISQASLNDLYQEVYADEPFVRLFTSPPLLKDVACTNFCDICPMVVKDKIVLFSNIDNLIKGASGQAIQNMNLVCELSETSGLL